MRAMLSPREIHSSRRLYTAGLAIGILATLLLAGAPRSYAEMWCGDGPGTPLSHACSDADEDPSVKSAIERYQDQWIQIEGVFSVDAGDVYHNREPDIEVHVESGSLADAREQIPSSVNGIPVVFVPGKAPVAGAFLHLPLSPAERARQMRESEAREKYEPVYTKVVQNYYERWDAVPGVLGIGPKCDRKDEDECDFSAAVVTVQRELLPGAQKEIPRSIDGIRIELVPDH